MDKAFQFHKVSLAMIFINQGRHPSLYSPRTHQESLLPFTGLKSLKIWLILNFLLEHRAFPSKLSPRPHLLAAICEGLLNNSAVQSYCQYPQLSTIQSEPWSARGSNTSSPAPSGTHKTPRPFLPPQKYVQLLLIVVVFCIKQAINSQ